MNVKQTKTHSKEFKTGWNAKYFAVDGVQAFLPPSLQLQNDRRILPRGGWGLNKRGDE